MRARVRSLFRDWLTWTAIVLYGWLVYVMVSSIHAKGHDVGAADLFFVLAFPAALAALATLVAALIRAAVRHQEIRRPRRIR